ncbi:Crp/Fnr family transcriptional regulator, partial [Staphylococcus sp. SIMBA_130]
EVFVINKNQLEKALMTNSQLTFEFMKWTSNHMRKFQSKIRDLLLNGKKGALYSTLIRLSNSYGTKQVDGILINLTLTNQELAKFIAATRESVNRMLVELRKLNVISIDKSGKILIKDIDYLREQIGCENCPVDICNIN